LNRVWGPDIVLADSISTLLGVAMVADAREIGERGAKLENNVDDHC
jgi:hypothetical protein